MFVPVIGNDELVWHGPGSGTSAAVDIFRADRAFQNSELQKFLGSLLLLLLFSGQTIRAVVHHFLPLRLIRSSDDFKNTSSKFSLWYDHARPSHPDIHRVVNDLILESAHDSVHR